MEKHYKVTKCSRDNDMIYTCALTLRTIVFNTEKIKETDFWLVIVGFYVCLERGSHSVAQAGLQLLIFLCQPPK
jgi:hypothetical protein